MKYRNIDFFSTRLAALHTPTINWIAMPQPLRPYQQIKIDNKNLFFPNNFPRNGKTEKQIKVIVRLSTAVVRLSQIL
jgi:hypothetical protein